MIDPLNADLWEKLNQNSVIQHIPEGSDKQKEANYVGPEYFYFFLELKNLDLIKETLCNVNRNDRGKHHQQNQSLVVRDVWKLHTDNGKGSQQPWK
jgi:hypothetical protein